MTETWRELVRTSAGQLHVRLSGRPDNAGAPVLLVHQTPASGRMWSGVMAALAPAFAMAPDLPGLGFSDPLTSPLDLAGMASAIVECINQIAPGRRWCVVGHHTGAAIAACLATQLRDQVSAMLLMGYPLYDGWRERYTRLAKLELNQFDAEGQTLSALWRHLGETFEDGTSQEHQLGAFVERLLPGELWYPPYVALFTADTEELLRNARDDGRPTTVLAPKHDLLSRYAVRVADILGVEVTSTDGGSWAPVERPEQVAEHIAALLARAAESDLAESTE
jgi:pimeloyl-ACP methyl ester carboxylesterase